MLDWSKRLVEMMSTIAAYDAKTRFAELLDRIERGESIVITRHGRPVARLTPVEDTRREAIADAVDRIKTRRRDAPRVSRDELRSWVREGHRR